MYYVWASLQVASMEKSQNSLISEKVYDTDLSPDEQAMVVSAASEYAQPEGNE